MTAEEDAAETARRTRKMAKKVEFTLSQVRILKDANWLVNGGMAYCSLDPGLTIEKLSKVDYVVAHNEEWNLSRYGILSSVGTLSRALFDAGRVYAHKAPLFGERR